MDDTQPQNNTSHKRVLKWVGGIGICLVLICGGLPTLLYLLFVPSKIEMAIGDELPDTAEVVHSAFDPIPMDPIHRFVIAFTDDQARDQIVNRWNLQAGTNNIMSSDTSSAPQWWPTSRLKQIEQSGECYGRVDAQAEQWWTVWIDRETNQLYLEVGDW